MTVVLKPALTSTVFHGPVTALEFHNDLLLAGKGSSLVIYNWSSSKILRIIKLFKRNKIQGIVVNSSKALIWGSYSFAIVLLSNLFEETSVKEYILPDWLMTGSWGFDGRAYFVTGHNALICIDSNGNQIEDITDCAIDCSLYSAALHITQTQVVIAAGTVFGPIDIWSNTDRKLICSLEGHEGSIFNVAFSQCGTLIASCSDDRSIRLWDIQSKTCLAIGWGHTARIWQLRFVDDLIVSTGEDNTAREWKQKDGKLVCTQVWEGHTGRNVWSLAINRTNMSVVATGGADGRIRLWDSEFNRNYIDDHIILFYDNIASQFKSTRGVVKQYAPISANTYAFSTTQGYIITYNLDTRIWSDLYQNSCLTGFSLMREWPGLGLIAVGDRFGKIFIISGNSGKVAIMEPPTSNCGKPTELLNLATERNIFMLVQYANSSVPWQFFKFDNASDYLHLTCSYVLEACSTFPFSAACLSDDGEALFIGSRFGGLIRYLLNHGSDRLEIKGCWRRIVSEDCITAMEIVFEQDDFVDLSFTTRSGSYAICSISKYSEKLETIHLNRVSKGRIEGAKYISGNLIVWGFWNNYFFVWNESEQYEIMSEVCGGPHRFWHFIIRSLTDYVFVYTKTASICFCPATIESKYSAGILQDGSHGREIRAMVTAPISNVKNGRLIASGSEDTCVRLANVFPDGSLKTLWILRRHVSGIQEIKWSRDGKFLFTSSAREEFFVWKVTLREKNVYIYPVAAAPVASEYPDLRVMDFTIQALPSGCYFISTVYSDSSIKCWKFDGNSLVLVGRGKYKTCCIFKVASVYSNGRYFVLAGSSDGYVSCWDLSLHLQSVDHIELVFPLPKWSLAIHQSSIKSMMIFETKSNLLIITGGDDNSLQLTRVSPDFTSASAYQSFPAAHASTVSALAKYDSNTIISAAVDQKIRVWQFVNENLQMSGIYHTSASDTGCLSIISERMMLVGGAGLDVLRVE
ncbi:WD40-repeat-containing domain protein [Lipomyces oligophaga]|uniref:WD40-repeat-containing domain protein n=1 Tax=Lipomyces oligophaga TaxID=45792 RepID=UPI0034CF2368